MTDRLFVYGTLAPGRPNEHVLADVPGNWQSATVMGKLFKDGWGMTHGYPAIVLDADGDKVEGFVLSSDELADHWDRLDEFEGDGYRRVATKATLEDGSIVEVNIYQLNKS